MTLVKNAATALYCTHAPLCATFYHGTPGEWRLGLPQCSSTRMQIFGAVWERTRPSILRVGVGSVNLSAAKCTSITEVTPF